MKNAASTGAFCGEAAHLGQIERLRAVVDARRQQEQQRHRQTVPDHEHHHAPGAEHRQAGDAEEGVAHVHDRAVADHLLEVALGHGDEADHQHVAQRKPGQQAGPRGVDAGQPRAAG